MTDPTLKQDGPANPTPAIPDLNDPNVRLSRNDAYKAMIARRRETVLNDMDAPDRAALIEARGTPADPTPADPDPDVDPADAAAETARRELEAGAAAAPPADTRGQLERQRAEPTILNDEDLPNFMVRTKVLGQEKLVPLDQVRTGFQKVESGDRYLQEARGLLTEVKQTIGQQQRADAPPAPASPPEPGQPSPADDPIDAYLQSMYQGDEQQAAAHLRRAIEGRPGATPLDPDAIANAVEHRIVMRNALRQFAKEHSRIMADPTLRRVTNTFLLEESGGQPLEALPAEEIPEVLERAGDRVNEWMQTVMGVAPATPPATVSRDERRKRKEGIDELPTTGARRASSVAPPQTNSDVIARMATQRAGQTRLPS